MDEKDRHEFDRMLVETEQQTEARNVAPLLAMMGGVGPKRDGGGRSQTS